MRKLLEKFLLAGVIYVMIGYVPLVRDNEWPYYIGYASYVAYSLFVLIRGVALSSKNPTVPPFYVIVAFPAWLAAHSSSCLGIHGIVFLNGSNEYHPWYLFAWGMFLVTIVIAVKKVLMRGAEVLD